MPIRPGSLALAVLLVISLNGCTTNPPDEGATLATHLAIGTCPGEPVPSELTVTCHRIEVEGASISVALLHAPDPTGNPVLFLHGGPGGRAVADRYRWLTPRSELLDTHDVVLVDQRGGGDSTPSMDCPEMRRPDAGEAALAGDRACRDRLIKSGIDPSSVNVEQIAIDLVAVRQALGIDRWHLHGVSFGSRVALELMRRDESAIVSAVLDSVVPPDADETADLPQGILAALLTLEDRCTGDGSCPSGVVEPLRWVLNHLEANPVVVQVDDRSFTVDDTVFLAAGVDTLSRPNGPALLPEALEMAVADRLAEAMAMLISAETTIVDSTRNVVSDSEVTRNGNTGDRLSEGVWAAVTCGDQLSGMSFEPTNANDPIHRAEHTRWVALRARCAAWQVPPTAYSTRLPVSSPVPTLILAGDLDPVTPSSWARSVARHLDDSTVVTSSRWTHAPSTWDPCATHLTVRFLATGERPSGTSPDC